LISWKHSFKRLNEEYELATKKKNALDNLLTSGKISQSTCNVFNREIDDAIAEIENQRKALLERMNAKVMELEEQLKTLEILLAKFEIQHVTGELDEQIYQQETDLLSMGLETTRQELDAVQEAVSQLTNRNTPLLHDAEPEAHDDQSVRPEAEFLGEPALPTNDEEPAATEEHVIETVECTAEAKQAETEGDGQKKQE
jgi:polyhydroxyalkanoate synthesis regulator phasin